MEAPIEDARCWPARFPTDAHEADGTLEWDATTIVITRVRAAGCCGVGDSYTDASAAALIYSRLAACVRGRDVMDVPACWWAMVADRCARSVSSLPQPCPE